MSDITTIPISKAHLEIIRTKGAIVSKGITKPEFSSTQVEYLKDLRLDYVIDRSALTLQDMSTEGVTQFIAMQNSIEASIALLTYLINPKDSEESI